MSAKAKTILFIAVLVLFIGGSVLLYNYLSSQNSPAISVEDSQGAVQSGDISKQKAPDFTAYDADGNAIKLSDMEGKPVVLNFWASWCPPCKGEMPHFDEVHAELGDEVQFMMVDLVDGGRETVETGATYIKEQGYGFPVYFDTDGEGNYIYGVRSIPTTIFIDKDGNVVASAQGAIDEATLRKGISMVQ